MASDMPDYRLGPFGFPTKLVPAGEALELAGRTRAVFVCGRLVVDVWPHSSELQAERVEVLRDGVRVQTLSVVGPGGHVVREIAINRPARDLLTTAAPYLLERRSVGPGHSVRLVVRNLGPEPAYVAATILDGRTGVGMAT